MKEELESEKLRECTFIPNIDKKPTDLRNFQEFIEDQNKFQKERKESIAKIAAEAKVKEEHLIGAQPLIDENSKSLVNEKRGKDPIYERLYAIRKKPIKDQDKDKDKEGPNKVFLFLFI